MKTDSFPPEQTQTPEAADAPPAPTGAPCSPALEASPEPGPARQVLQFFPPAQIAAALGLSKKTILRRADELKWPREQVGVGCHYLVPAEIAAKIALLDNLPSEIRQPKSVAAPAVKFSDIANDPVQAKKVGRRQQAVEMYLTLQHLGKELALYTTCRRMTEEHNFPISTRSLRAWRDAFAAHGVNGLVEQKRGAVGRRGVYVPDHIVNLGKALVIERGSVARAARELALHPDLPGEMRLYLHDGHAAKSYVTPSIARAISPAQATKDLAQGPRHHRLHGRFTPGDYSEFQSGDWFCSDDMTCNVMSWCEWPNALGWRIGQAQLLPIIDVRSLRWLNFRMIIRDGGQYNAQDDIWGLFGDVFDQYGLPGVGFVLEGGHWQSNVIRGVRTGLDDATRIGGLESLGLQNRQSYDPRSKIIEPMFNLLQHHMDRVPGFVGRDQRTDLGEAIKKRIALLRVKHPVHHPREFFPHLSQLADHVREAMGNMNQERQDGAVLRGKSPLEMWAEHNPQLHAIPDSAKWLYRSAVSVSKVTCNGVRVTRGSGSKLEAYYYDNPEMLVPRQGQKVIIHWNDANPAADACLREFHSRKFLCLAKYVKPLSRFAATDAELTSEAKRKQAAALYARTELRNIQPDLVRSSRPIPVGATASDFGAKMADAAERQENVEKSRATVRRAVAKVEITDSDRAAILANPPDRSAKPVFSPAELAELLQ